MKELSASPKDTPRSLSPLTIRDCAAVGFRQSRIILYTFTIVFSAVMAITWVMPAEYESEVKILVKRERVDPIVTPENNAQPVIQRDLTEEDLNSEVEILKSEDLIEKVAVESGLTELVSESRLKGFALGWIRNKEQALGQDIRTVRATQLLENKLKIEPLKKTRLIKVTYRSTSPRLAATVLQTLVRVYTEKHLDVHGVPGALDFFQTQTEEYRKQLADAEKKIAEFGGAKGVVAPQLEKEMAVRRLNDFEAEAGQTRAAIAATEKRIETLKQLQAATPARLTTQVRTSDNPLLLQQMKSSVLNLELKRTELLSKYAPGYPLVREVDAQIAQARDALAKAEGSPMREEVTDRDATHEWLTSELAKAQADFISLRGKLVVTSQTVDKDRRQAQQLSVSEIAQQDLVRSAKAAEENFVLYSRKQEEARISQALDQRRILNVSIVEAPTLPALPASPNWPLNLLLGVLLAGLASVGLGLAKDYIDPSFRTPDEVEVFLSVPVLASLSLEPGEIKS